MAKIHYISLKIFFSRIIGPISTKLGVRGHKVLHIRITQLSKKISWIFYSPNPHYYIIIALSNWVYWFELVSQMSNVAHWPLVVDIVYLEKQHIILTFQYCFHYWGVLWLNMSYEIGKITPKIWGKGTYICIGQGANEGPNFREWESWYEKLEVFTLEDLYFHLAHLSLFTFSSSSPEPLDNFN